MAKQTKAIVKKDIVKKKPRQSAIKQTDPGSLLQLAIEKKMDMEKLSQLLDIYQRWEADKAKKEYFINLAKFQKECPVIEKKKAGYNNRYFYAPIEDIIEQVKDVLEKYGFSYTFQQEQQQTGIIKITCSLHHSAGHTESASLSAHADSSGGKNDIQSIGSTVTYLRRYTFCGITGITTADSDNDGYTPIMKSEKNKVEDAEIIKEKKKTPAQLIGSELIVIMNTDYFTDDEKTKFKKWLPQNKGLKIRKEKLEHLKKIFEKRKKIDDKDTEEAGKIFDNMNNKLDEAMKPEISNVF